MKKLKLTMLVGLGLGSFSLSAQQSPASYKTKYPDEFAVTLKDHTTTSIEVRKGSLDISRHIFKQTLFLDKRISSMGKVSINYQPPFSEIEALKAYTLVPDGDQYSKEKVRTIEDREVISENIFYDGNRAKMFTYPGLREGAITTLEYTENIHEPKLLSSEVFQGYQLREEHIFTLEHDEEVEIDIAYFNCTREDFRYEREEKSGKIIQRWTPKAYSKLVEESEMPEFLALAPHIIYRIVSYRDGDRKIPVLQNTGDLYQWYSGLLKEVRQDDNPALQVLTDSLVQGAEDDHEKTQRIFNWVQDHIKYIAIENGMEGFRPRTPSLIFDRRYGDCKDMSCLTIAMLTHADIPAFHTWIGTRSLPYSYEQVPSPLADNHMIACARLNGEYVFLDATDRNLPFPLPSSFIQDKEALIGFNADSFAIHTVPIVPSDRNLTTDSVYIQLSGTTISGEGTKGYNGYYLNLFNRNLNSKDQDDLKEVFKQHARKGNNKCISSGYQVQSQPGKKELLYRFEVPGYAYENGDQVILNLNLERIMSDFAVKKDRVHPVEYEHTYRVERKVVLRIPENYQLDYLPEDQKYWSGPFGFSLSYTQRGDEIRYHLLIDVDTLTIEPDQFEDWNTMIRNLNRAFSETLSLKKI